MREPFKRGETVVVTYDGKTCTALIELASANGKSIMISFQAMLGGHVGMMPIYRTLTGGYASLLEQRPVILERRELTEAEKQNLQ